MVASTLIEIKSRSLIPTEEVEIPDEYYQNYYKKVEEYVKDKFFTAEPVYKKQPENKQILLQYISILNMLDDKKDIHNLLDLSKTISWDENSIKVIVHSFILNERYQEALDMAFEYASSGSQKGKDLYFQIAEFNCELHNIVNHDYDFIFDGAYGRQ